jgi:hypothetical protein
MDKECHVYSQRMNNYPDFQERETQSREFHRNDPVLIHLKTIEHQSIETHCALHSIIDP